MIKIISGGQTGADLAGLFFAHKAKLETGGVVPMGFRTTDGNHPELARFGCQETLNHSYNQRTRINVQAASVTLLFTVKSSPGSNLTRKCCREARQPWFDIVFHRRGGKYVPAASLDPVVLALIGFRTRFGITFQPTIINVAGHSSETWPDAFILTFITLCQIFKQANIADVDPALAPVYQDRYDLIPTKY